MGDALTDLTPKKAKIVQMRETGATWSEIAEACQCARMTLWQWRKDDPEFAAACEAASEVGVEELEDALQVSALKVVDDPRYTTALIFSLKNRRPEKWRDAKQHEHSGRVQLEHLSMEELERMAHALDEPEEGQDGGEQPSGSGE